LPRLGGRDTVPDIPDPVGERLQSRFPCDRGLRLPLHLVRQIEIFKRIETEGPENRGLQVVGEFSLAFDLFHDEGLPLNDGVPSFPGIQHLLDCDLIDIACLLLAVPGNKRNRAALFGQTKDSVCGKQRNRRMQ
jgi:hypothetical protein